MEQELNELYELTQVEYVRELDNTESSRYLYLWETLKANDVDINFTIEL